MKAIVTGAHGTVGSRLCEYLRRQGAEVVGWDRDRVPVDDYWAMEGFVRSVAPDALFHLATASRPTGRPNESWLVN
ncbi:MAG TPA: NAD-dependent epimerase/dehydratase family protein, partial [Archangium sp.]